VAELGIALSEYSRKELVDAGFAQTAVCPMAVTGAPATVRRTPDAAAVLGVGRIAPNKRWELAVRAMAALRRERPDARMEIVGNDEEMTPYARALRRMSARLNAATVLCGKVSRAELEAAYARATVLLLPSAHEGLGLPLLEAMARDVPVVATAQAAIPETVDGAGLLCGDDPVEIAAAIARVIADGKLRGALVARGRRRAAGYDDSLVRSSLAAALTSWGPR
jgi:glycosyltransferase involved in cell wall biosynthesis